MIAVQRKKMLSEQSDMVANMKKKKFSETSEKE